MKKQDIIDRIAEIVKNNNNTVDLCQFDVDPKYYPAYKSGFHSCLTVNKNGSIILHDKIFNKNYNIKIYQKYILANILYEIGDKQDMINMKGYINPFVYALCLNRLHKSYDD